MSLLDLARIGNSARPYNDPSVFETDISTLGVLKRKFNAMDEFYILDDKVAGQWNHVKGSGEIYYSQEDAEAERKKATGAQEYGIVKTSKMPFMSSIPGDTAPLSESAAPSAFHLKRLAIHEAEAKRHLDFAAKIQKGSPLANEAVKRHEYASRVHQQASEFYRKGDGGQGRVYGKSASLHSSNADVFTKIHFPD